jgi:EAL domain-containing protein (putative c-di-GMP-specific phosphodiesterase class I)
MGLGCDVAQGYGIARPMGAEDVVDWVASYVQPSQWQDLTGH